MRTAMFIKMGKNSNVRKDKKSLPKYIKKGQNSNVKKDKVRSVYKDRATIPMFETVTPEFQ